MKINIVKHMSLRITAVLLLLAISLSLITPSLSVFTLGEDQENQNNAKEISKLVTRALALQNILRRIPNLNLSREVLARVENLVSIDVRNLTVQQLNDFIANCKEVLARVEREIRKSWNIDIGNIYAIRFRIAIEARLRVMEKLYNVSLEYEIKNLTSTRDWKELYRSLKLIEKSIEKFSTRVFINEVVRGLEKTINTTIDKAEVRDLDKAIIELSKVEWILNRVINRFEKLNISREAIEHIQIAIEHISIAGEILRNISVELKQQMIKPERVREKIREIANKTLEKLYSCINETLNNIKEEINQLIDKALEINASKTLEELEKIIQSIEEIEQGLQQTNITIDKLHEVSTILAKIRIELKKIEKEIEDCIEIGIPRREIDKAFNTTLTKALENLSKVKEMISYIENKSKEIVCIAIYPPPPICRYINITFSLLNKSKYIVGIVEEIINKAIELYNNGSSIQALHLIVKANAMLVNVRAWLEPIYRTLLEHEKISEGTNKIKEELISRLDKAIKRLNSVDERIISIREKVENLTKPVKQTVERMLKETEYLINKAKELIDKAKEAIEYNNISELSRNVVEIENLIKLIENKLQSLEKILSIKH